MPEAFVAPAIYGVSTPATRDPKHHQAGAATRTSGQAGLRTVSIEELLVWTYADQLARRLGEAGAGLYPAERLADGVRWQETSRCGCAEIARIGRLGTRIDSAPERVRKSTDVDHDAETVHSLLSAQPDRDAVGLVIECGETGRRPDWKPRGMRWGPLFWNPRKTTAIIEYSEDRAPYCPIILIDSADSVAFARTRYTTYMSGLSYLASLPRLTRTPA